MYVKQSVKQFTGLLFVSLLLILSSSACGRSALPDFTQLVEDNSAAVVNISTKQKIKNRGLPKGHAPVPRRLPQDSPWGDLLDKFLGEHGGMPMPDSNAQSLGSGFIIDESGYLLTNYHVVKGADEILVRLNDRRELLAEVIGLDKRSDIALLKIDAKNLPVVKIGTSKKLKVGEWVMAIGSPFGFDHSVSVGVVSAMGRNLPSETYVPFIQTDVAINPGNSGGPLFNLNGEVIGVNSQIYSRTGGFMGLSFAIPMDIVMNVVKQLKEKGVVTRGYLGILIQNIDVELAKSFNMENPQGAVVVKILSDSPAEKAGFLPGDVVINFNGVDIISSQDLPVAVGRTEIDKKVEVNVIRQGKSKILHVVVGTLPTDDNKVARIKSYKHSMNKLNRLGTVVDELSKKQRKQLELEGRGILVSMINKEGVAYKAGLRKGDVILMLNNKNINSVKQFTQMLKNLPINKSLPLLIQRGRSPSFLAITLIK